MKDTKDHQGNSHQSREYSGERENMNRTTRSFMTVALLVPAMIMLAAESAKAPDADYVQSFEKWKAERTADLKENWLSLAGLFWLKPGANTFGSNPDNAIVFPKGPGHAGEFDLNGSEVTLKLLPDSHATIDGQAATSVRLDPDTSKQVTRVEMGTLGFHVIIRGDRVGVRVRDADSPAARAFKGMMFFPLDLNYRVTARWIPSDGKKTIEIPNVLGDVAAAPVPGDLVFKVNRQELRLTATGGDSKQGLFLVFNDLTARSDTYPGGRFLDTGPIVDGGVVLDFNRAYNPPCAVTPYATCPLAPKENRLAVPITAGEKFDQAVHAHHKG
jgi:uncharacterized protein (DUF1684 family)